MKEDRSREQEKLSQKDRILAISSGQVRGVDGHEIRSF